MPRLPRLPPPPWTGLRFSRFPVARQDRVFDTTYEGVLGTSLHLRLVGPDAALRLAEAALFAEIDRLEALFSRFQPDSELNRFLARHGQPVEIPPELGQLMTEALAWQHGTGGAFNPASDALSAVWRAAEQRQQLPPPEELAALSQAIQPPAYQVSADGRSATRLSTLPLNFNAFAKGRIVDLAARAALATPGVRDVLLNLGGDLTHRGTRPALVWIADPFSRADNAPPVAGLRVQNQAVATSGHTWRGFQVAGRWYSHMLDPHSGWPAEDVAGVSVLADDAATADVLATALTVLTPREGLALANSLPRVGCHITTRHRETHTNALWQAQRA